MADVMVSVSAGVMKSLLAKLTTLLGKEYKLLKDVKDEITFLRDEMSTMKALLEELAKTEELDAQQKERRDKVRELAYDIEDHIDDFMHHLGCGDASAGSMLNMVRQLKALKERHRIANHIRQLKDRVMEESERQNRYKHDKRPVEPGQSSVVAVDPRLRALYEDASGLVGIDDPKEKIKRWLMEETDGERFKVVSIVGFGGLGKTTLAHQVYSSIKSEFKCSAFVSVSRNPNITNVLRDILKGVGSIGAGTVTDLRNLINLIRDHLRDKRYLIVIDDIWSAETCDIINCAFIKNNRANRVIRTTRNEDVVAVASASFCDYVYMIKPLDDLHSRRLFFKRVFGSDGACPEQFKKISEEILKKCGGVPLAIISIAGILAGQVTQEKWEKIQESLRWQLERHPEMGWMRYVLNLSYNDLSPDIRTCMLYLASFPEDCVILKDDLVRRWIAEGFVTDKYGCGQEDEAESYFNELINRNIIHPADFDDCGEVISCRVHDLMHDFIMTKSIDENFITVITDQQSTKGSFEVRRLSLQIKNTELNPVLASISLSQARSLTYQGPAQCIPPLSKFQHLRVLDLDAYDSKNKCYDLTCIDKFFQLRYLRIRGIKCKLPRQIGALKYLQTLELDDRVMNLPLDVCELSLLSHLIVPRERLPDGIGKMRTLRTLKVGRGNIQDLSELINLRELTLGHATSFLDSSICTVGFCNLRSLIIHSCSFDLFRCWSPPRHLQQFHVMFNFSKIPEWIAQLDQLTRLDVNLKVLSREDVDVLSKLPSLRHLNLRAEEIPKERVVVCNTDFPSLKELIWYSREVPCLMFEPGAMSNIQNLYITFLERGINLAQVDDVFTGIEHLQSLKSFRVLILKTLRGGGPGVGVLEDAYTAKRREQLSKELRRIRVLEVALRKAINKHPGSPSVIIESF